MTAQYCTCFSLRHEPRIKSDPGPVRGQGKGSPLVSPLTSVDITGSHHWALLPRDTACSLDDSSNEISMCLVYIKERRVCASHISDIMRMSCRQKSASWPSLYQESKTQLFRNKKLQCQQNNSLTMTYKYTFRDELEKQHQQSCERCAYTGGVCW